MKKIFVLLGILMMLIFSLSALALDKEYGDLGLSQEKENYMDLNPSVVNIEVSGNGIGYFPQKVNGKISLIEGRGSFTQWGTGFIVSDKYVITAAHVVTPHTVKIRSSENVYYITEIYKVNNIHCEVGEVPAHIAYSNVEQDIAILELDEHSSQIFVPLPMPLMFTNIFIPTPAGIRPGDLIQPEDAIEILVYKRGDQREKLWYNEIRKGYVKCNFVCLPKNHERIAQFFKMSDVTMDIKLYPGDSGAPVIGFYHGKPYIIGVATRALIESEEPLFFFSRITVALRFLMAHGVDVYDPNEEYENISGRTNK